MINEKLVERLRSLGIDRENYRVLALLPLVQVAWADGRVQQAEEQLITEAATQLGLEPGGTWVGVLQSWLRSPPSDLDYLRGQQALLALAQLSASDLDQSTLGELIDLSAEVAQAAGGLFGVMFQIEDTEKRALNDIAQILSLGPTIDWSRVKVEETTTW